MFARSLKNYYGCNLIRITEFFLIRARYIFILICSNALLIFFFKIIQLLNFLKKILITLLVCTPSFLSLKVRRMIFIFRKDDGSDERKQ